jgi:hypothetical protein
MEFGSYPILSFGSNRHCWKSIHTHGVKLFSFYVVKNTTRKIIHTRVVNFMEVTAYALFIFLPPMSVLGEIRSILIGV